MNQKNFGPNTRYLKIEYLKNNQFDGFIIGTSRSNAYSAHLLSRLTGLNIYNMNAPSETPYDSYLKFQWLLDRHDIKKIILPLDFDQFDAPLIRAPYDLLRQEHPAVSNIWSPLFFWKYLWATPRQYVLTVFGNYFMENTWYHFDIATGHFHFPLYDKMMADDPTAYVAKRFSAQAKLRNFTFNPKHLFYFRKIIDLARSRGVEVVAIINPLNHRLYKSFDQSVYTDWRNKIISIAGSAWDFSGLNGVTKQDRNYYELSHFTRKVGDLVLQKIFDKNNAAAVHGIEFGVFRTMRSARLSLPTSDQSRLDPPGGGKP
jgi:hypothetical protein